MAAKPNKGFLEKVEEEIAKQGKNVRLAANVAKDVLKDKALQEAPRAAVLALNKLEQGRRFLQQGTVPGAASALARTKAEASVVSGIMKGLGNAHAIKAAIELGKGSYLIGKEGARKGHSEAGKQLIKEPLAYQAANLLVSPADALSKYGAAREAEGKKAFEERYINPLKRRIEAEDERKARADQSNRDVPAVEIRKGAQPNPRKFFK
jgi:hypothetical protein